jgi:ELWxxDGT repeat protein
MKRAEELRPLTGPKPHGSRRFPWHWRDRTPAENGTLFFVGWDYWHGSELWKSDGTTAGTVMVADINPGRGGSNPGNLTNVNGTLFFTANDGTHGVELWKSDGTAAGTVMVQDIYPGSSWHVNGGYSYYGPNSSSPSNLTNVNGELFFVADDGVHGRELWKSNGTGTTINKKNGGTTSGTVLVADINPGSSSSNPSNLINVNGLLYFTANDGTHGQELWKSDGTAAGTVMIKDINPGSGSSNPGNLTKVNGTLLFSASDGAHGNELWKSDGTTAGTVMVADINPGSGGSYPCDLTNVNGTLFFSANDGTHGYELWQSDGTAAGTVLVADINPGSGNFDPGNLTNVNGTPFFSANDGVRGYELWRLPSATVTGPSVGALNQALTFTLGVIGYPAGAVFTFNIDWNGDGLVDQTVTGPNGTTVSHSYTTSSTDTIGVTATDAGGSASSLAYQSVQILPVSVMAEADPADTTKEMLFIDGTASNDTIVLAGNNSSLTLTFDGTSLGNIVPAGSSPVGLVVVNGEGGDDVLDARALGVSSVLEGGSGNDTLYGGSAPNLLIGGAGSDALYAGSAGDILIGGTTSYDSNLTALAYIMAEWGRTDVSYATRVGQLNGSLSRGLNGPYLLGSTTVFDDSTTDVLYGGAGLDWFFAHLNGSNKDQVKGQTSGEVITSI